MKSIVLLGALLSVAPAGCGGGVAPARPGDAATDVPSAPRPDAARDAPADACVFFAPQVGCVGEAALTVANPHYPSTVADTRVCTAVTEASTVRLRLCVAPPRVSCNEDDGVAYCAVVDLARDALPALAGGAELRLDGGSRFVFTGPRAYQVQPSDVSYTATAPATGVQRVWMEKACFCTPTSLAGAQTFTGSLRLDAAPTGRLRGRLTLAVDGIVSPTTWFTERVELATGFDVAIAPAE